MGRRPGEGQNTWCQNSVPRNNELTASGVDFGICSIPGVGAEILLPNCSEDAPLR